MWQRVEHDTNDWNSRDNAEKWRAAWAKKCNQYLSPGDKIDHRSFLRRGIDRAPTIHEGYFARAMERRGEVSSRCQLNREIRALNEARHQLELEQRGIIVSLERARIDREIQKMREEIQAIRNYRSDRYDAKQRTEDRAGALKRFAERRREKNIVRRADKSGSGSVGRNQRRSFEAFGSKRYMQDLSFFDVDQKEARAGLLLPESERRDMEINSADRVRNRPVQREAAGADADRIAKTKKQIDAIRRRKSAEKKAAEKSAVKEQSKRISATASKISSIKETRAASAQMAASKQALTAGIRALEKGVDFATGAIEKMLPDDAGKLVTAAVKTAKAALNPKNLLPHNTLKVAFDIIGTAAKAGEHNAQAFLHNPGALPDNIKGMWEWMSNTEKAEMLYKMSLRDDMELGTSSFMSNYKPSPAPQREKVRSL